MSARDAILDVAVVGGGLAGLAAAAFAARRGRRVAVFERAGACGGRARTERADGFAWNLGPHALYRRGAGAGVLRELGVAWSGRAPSTRGALAVRGGRLAKLPAGPLSLATTDLVGWRDKLVLGGLLARLPRLDPAPLASTSVSEWLERDVAALAVREVMHALVRLTTYTHAPAELSAGAALAQIQLALRGNVAYLDGGWGTLVAGLESAARAAGADVRVGARVESVDVDERVRAVRLAGGERIETRTVVVAAEPREASRLLGEREPLARWAREVRPARAACLDVALARLPRPRAFFALGIDEPSYASVHSAFARLAPDGGAVLHAARYLAPDEEPDAAVEAVLERSVERLQPGWRAHVVRRRFLPSLTVAQHVPLAGNGGLGARPGPAVPGVEGLFVVGDWVGPTGLLADAALASARAAGHSC